MTKTTLRRLVESNHSAVFDIAPQGVMVFRLQHPARARWVIAARVLTVSAGIGNHVYPLANYTLFELRQALVADGFQVEASPAAAAFYPLSAMVLAEGAGDEYESNGDHIYAYTSLLWVLMSAYEGEIDHAQAQVLEAIRQMYLTTAEGEWLDLWGALYGVPRVEDETDAAYRLRIAREAFRLRNNPRAIELAIKDQTGFDVRIEEPWTQIFRLDESLLSGPDMLYDGSRIGYHLIQPVTSGYIDWPAVRAVIERNRPAGVLVLEPTLRYVTVVDGTGDSVDSAIYRDRSSVVRYEDTALLDYMLIGDVSIPNYPVIHRQEIMHPLSFSEVPPLSWISLPWGAVGAWDAKYVVDSITVRDYRETYGSGLYAGQYWGVIGGTWTSNSSTTWGVDAIVGSVHVSE